MGATWDKSTALKIEREIASERRAREAAIAAALRAFEGSFDREIVLRLRHAKALGSVPKSELKLEDLSRIDRDLLGARDRSGSETGTQTLYRLIEAAGPGGIYGRELNKLAQEQGLTLGTIERSKQRLKTNKVVERSELGAWILKVTPASDVL